MSPAPDRRAALPGAASGASAGPALELRGVSFAYESGSILGGIDLRVAAGEFALLVGANGSGKTTLLRVAIGLLAPAAGEARLFGLPAGDLGARARLGYVPQRAAISPRVPATVLEVVAAGRAHSPYGFFRRADRAAAERALGRVGLARLSGRRIGELSGGQQQRVLIARALASDPALLVLDEPTAGVDRASQERFAEVLGALNRDGVTVFMVAHDLGAVAGSLTRVLALHQGHIDEVPVAEARERVGVFLEDHSG
ncbi:MAG: metal ABC transporter ATP-binding protein [Acidobacteria bacterium]|nr:metal ABC transporter ATP-binding protein [Acidobacteriota bacterium]